VARAVDSAAGHRVPLHGSLGHAPTPSAVSAAGGRLDRTATQLLELSPTSRRLVLQPPAPHAHLELDTNTRSRVGRRQAMKCCGDPSDCQGSGGEECTATAGTFEETVAHELELADARARQAAEALEVGEGDVLKLTAAPVSLELVNRELAAGRVVQLPLRDVKVERRTIVLEKAAELVAGPRQGAYGHPLPNHERIARLYTARLYEKLKPGEVIEPEDVTALMRLTKEARLIESPGHGDSLIDLAGYAEAEAMIHDGRERRGAGEEL
jgi:hypothetical protein